MNKYIKGSLKVLTNYCTFMIIFAVFLSMLIGIARENFISWLPVYSGAIFFLMMLVLYSDMKSIAVKEKRPQYNLSPYPFKGFILGVLGFSPFILLQLIYPLINLDNPLAARIKHLALNTLLGPVYVFIRLVGDLGGGAIAAYAIASLTIPVIAMFGYMAGFYGIELGAYYRKLFRKADNTGARSNPKK